MFDTVNALFGELVHTVIFDVLFGFEAEFLFNFNFNPKTTASTKERRKTPVTNASNSSTDRLPPITRWVFTMHGAEPSKILSSDINI